MILNGIEVNRRNPNHNKNTIRIQRACELQNEYQTRERQKNLPMSMSLNGFFHTYAMARNMPNMHHAVLSSRTQGTRAIRVELYAGNSTNMCIGLLGKHRIIREVDHTKGGSLGNSDQLGVKRIPCGTRAGLFKGVEEELLERAVIRNLISRITRTVNENDFVGKGSFFQIAWMPDCSMNEWVNE